VGLGQGPELVVPVPLERVGHEPVARIDQQEAALGEGGVELRALNPATA
jgi:hypothetical protein